MDGRGDTARDDPAVVRYFAECLKGEHGPAAHLAAMTFASDRIDGKVPTVTKIQGGDEPLTVIVKTGV